VGRGLGVDSHLLENWVQNFATAGKTLLLPTTLRHFAQGHMIGVIVIIWVLAADCTGGTFTERPKAAGHVQPPAAPPAFDETYFRTHTLE
jgi:hypothetical protein